MGGSIDRGAGCSGWREGSSEHAGAGEGEDVDRGVLGTGDNGVVGVKGDDERLCTDGVSDDDDDDGDGGNPVVVVEDGRADEEGGNDEEREVDNAMNQSIASLSTSYGKMASRPSIAIGWILSQMT